MKTIAIVDDDVYIGDMLETLLTREGYRTLRAYSGTEALLLLRAQRPDLILLDLMLPGLSGEEVLAQTSGIPIIVVSAREDVQGKVQVLMDGAVDYLTKPFDTRELLARIAVHLRTFGRPEEAEVFHYDNLRLDPAARVVSAPGGEARLTRTEFAILRLLMRNPGQVIAKSRMLERISEDTPDCVESSLKVHVSNLRRKLRQIGGRDYIEAVWGIGFQLN